MNNLITIRFILDRNHQYVGAYSKDSTFRSIEESLREKKPIELFNDSQIQNLQQYDLIFLYSGKIFQPENTIKDIQEFQNKQPYNIKILIQKSIIKQQPQQNLINTATNTSQQPTFQQASQFPVTANSTPVGSNTNSQDDEGIIHFHGCQFDVDEFNQMENIFQHKQINNKISIAFLNNFLHSYWKYLQENSNNTNISNNSQGSFPVKKLSKILKQVLNLSSIGQNTTITREEFRIIFFLFSTNANENECPNGSKENVKRMIQQYHNSISNQQMNQETFENLYSLVKTHQTETYQNLSCRNIELLFYLYSADILLNVM